MGYTHYVVIPKHKLLIEVKREIDKTDEKYNFGLLSDEFHIDLDVPYKNLKLDALYKLIKYYDESTKYFNLDELLIGWLNGRGIDYEVITEYYYSDNKDKYLDYLIIDMR